MPVFLDLQAPSGELSPCSCHLMEEEEGDTQLGLRQLGLCTISRLCIWSCWVVLVPDVGQRALHLPNVHLLSWGAAAGLGCGHTGGRGTAPAVVSSVPRATCKGELRSCGIWYRPLVSPVATTNLATVTVQPTQGGLCKPGPGGCLETQARVSPTALEHSG